MTICSWDYLEEYESERAELLQTVDEVFQSGNLVLGTNVSAFEDEFANYCDTAHGIGVANGTDALFLALKAFGIGAGDEVITVANTAIPTVSAIVSAGATPRFVDINLVDFLIDCSRIEELLTPATRCILPVHLYGQCVQMDEILALAERYKLVVIEDCAQAHGATFKTQKAGSMGNAAAFSFYPTKVLGAYGDAGMVVTGSKTVATHLRRLRSYGTAGQYYAKEHGYNSRLDELHAAMLRKKLTRIDDYIKKRRLVAQRYDDLLQDTSLALPLTSNDRDHVYYLYACRHPERDRIISDLAKQGIFLGASYRWPIHLMTGYEFLGYSYGDLPSTEQACRQVLCLPLYPRLSIEKQDIVIQALRQAC